MSWLFSQALVAASSADICSDGEPSAQLNVMPTAQPFWRNDKTMEPSRLSRFGLTLRLLTEQDGEAVLMSFLEGFPAKTSAQPERGQELTEIGQGSGESLRGWFAKYDPITCSWRTAQRSLVEDLELFSETWPRWGLMRDGACCLLPTVALPICESASGLWPTPRTTGLDGGQNSRNAAKARGMWPTPCARDFRYGMSQETVRRRKEESARGVNLSEEMQRHGTNGQLNPTWVEWLMGWPIEWTKLKPLETAKFQEWQQQHGVC